MIHHADRGCHSAAEAYQRVLRDHAIVCSMSRKGNGWDHAVTESFFATLKTPWPSISKASTIPTGYTRRWDTSAPTTLNGGMLDRLSVQHN